MRKASKAKTKERLDVVLVARGLAPTREKAARLILAGEVVVGGQRVDKAGALVDQGAPVEVAAGRKFVSRGGEKLAPILEAFAVSARGRICVDVGASTGGFTQCLLERGAVRVYAVDAGHGQLDAGLRADGRVVVMEKTNARHLVAATFPELPELATVDVSFI
ncbi:MAG TPA: TlyA family RNA methyltransferase, partial [Candidatus Methylomirabilis sp.]|nr:TlyA family RNA methyltransferase [Candidatus Methylomirabilis sp.]